MTESVVGRIHSPPDGGPERRMERLRGGIVREGDVNASPDVRDGSPPSRTRRSGKRRPRKKGERKGTGDLSWKVPPRGGIPPIIH